MFENSLKTKLEPYLTKKFDFDPILLTDLSRRKFFQREKILRYLERYDFDNFQLQNFLSFTYEKLLDYSLEKQKSFLKAFGNDLTKFSKDRAIISFLSYSYFADSEEIFELLAKLEEVKIEKGSVEAFDLVARHMEYNFGINTGIACTSTSNAKKILQSSKVMANFLEVDLSNFKGFFREKIKQYKKEIHYNAAKELKRFLATL